MINTPAFESAERLRRLTIIHLFIKTHKDETKAYHWILPHIYRTINKEKAFARANKIKWEEEFLNNMRK